MSERGRGMLVVVSGPSGAGKTSICEALLRRLSEACWSVSVTTRAQRPHEVDGQHYRFVSDAEFDRMLAEDELLEHAEYLSRRYGTPRGPVEAAIAQGRIVLLDIEVQGGAQIARRMPESVRIFVLPPTRESLRARLEGRNTESEALQRQRLEEADGEIAFAHESGIYRYFITNDILNDSVNRIEEIIRKESQRT